MAEEIFELTSLGSLARNKPKPKGGVDLTESEFLTLDFLAKGEPLTVGELQKSIRVLPAQMSRVIRALEGKADKPLIRCEINAKDKRRVDVWLTELGKKARDEYRNARLASTIRILEQLPESDCREFMRILNLIREHLASSLQVQ